jgi:hypothetical protein
MGLARTFRLVEQVQASPEDRNQQRDDTGDGEGKTITTRVSRPP